MTRFKLLFAGLLIADLAQAQIDTINTTNHKLISNYLREGKSSYVILLEDSLGRRMGPTQIWDRAIQFSKDAKEQRLYTFNWKYYMKDTLYASYNATGYVATMAPLSHRMQVGKVLQRSVVFNGNQASVPEADRAVVRDKRFTSATLDPPAFSFPMDLEILPMLPIRNVGQEMAVAFYEPGMPASAYYKLTVQRKESLPIASGVTVDCWVLIIDYGPASATFWISRKGREVLKTKDGFRGITRYKIKLY